jgi:hypothetical protein
MYNPKQRLFQFVPSKNQEGRDEASSGVIFKEPTSRIKKTKVKSKKTVYIHVVNIDQLYAEFEQTDRAKSIRDLCGMLETRKHITLLGESQTPDVTAAKFGTGNLILYAATHGKDDMPQYLALGKTAGCRVEGKKLYGALHILTAFGGHTNPYTQNAVEHDHRDLPGRNVYSSYLHWDILPRRPLWKLLKNGFIKPYVAKFAQVYSELRTSHDVRGIVTKFPVDARSVLLMRKLFTYSEEAEHAFVETFDS